MGIKTVKNQYTDQLMSLPNVRGVGIGEKEGREVIKVLVEKKVPVSELRPEEVVPKRLKGYETVVEEIGVVSVEPP